MDKFTELHLDDIKIVLNVNNNNWGYSNKHKIYIPVNTLYPMMHTWMQKMMQPSGDGNTESVQMSKLIKTGVKGLLIMYGDKLLTQMLGKDHPKPSKSDDLVEWYTDIFARIALTMATKTIYLIHSESDEDDFSKVSEFSTIPVSEQG